jgi:flavin-binding protein dodecin
MAKKNAESGVVLGYGDHRHEHCVEGDAAKNAVETAAKSLRALRVAEVRKLDMKVEGGRVVAYRARVSLSFKYDG